MVFILKIAPVPTEPVEISVGKPLASGNETLVPIFISGAVQDLRAASLTLSGSFGKLISADKGDLLNLLHYSGYADEQSRRKQRLC